MEWLSLLLAAVLFAAACNLDTVILSMGYAVKGVRVSLSHSLIIAALTTLITWASLLLGAGAARVLTLKQLSEMEAVYLPQKTIQDTLKERDQL